MSTESIARWNAIPLERETLKRPRPEDDDSDDDISLVSRTPSPPPDPMDIDKYDEYVARPEQEVITVETKIKPTNKGFAMLAKLGWVEGQPLGVSGEGRVDPIPFQIKRDSTGLGTWTQDVRMIESTVSQRREMDSEKLAKETEEQRRAREDLVARRTALDSELSTAIKAFYCELCEKQFKTVVAYTEHTNSYAHHHKARFKDMQANIRIPQDDVDKRKEKERKREEKELRKIAAANGIKMAKPTPAVIPTLAPAEPVGASIDGEPMDSGRPSASSSGFKKSGWATVGSSTSAGPPPEPAVPSAPSSSFNHSASRTGGWASLGSGSSQSSPPPASPRLPHLLRPPAMRLLRLRELEAGQLSHRRQNLARLDGLLQPLPTHLQNPYLAMEGGRQLLFLPLPPPPALTSATPPTNACPRRRSPFFQVHSSSLRLATVPKSRFCQTTLKSRRTRKKKFQFY
ncbi:G-patch-domain Zn-finger DNA-binding protein [Mycena sanguinolenta]|uniref:G-patch-domain Zn-finger DNA-binding protein n=1 Tax=Mycena sanguinolenta TaxID=230812 RepID=A0A8H7CLG1_9AGAR|nr:G-patch-domain Zn-finger DNA-binding protein [Mycena sanguinolenta]